MLKIRTLEVAGIGPAIHAMRNPMNSWHLSDSKHGLVGAADYNLSKSLAKSGPEHAKHLRMCMVWFEMEAPMLFWNQFDTYRAGVEKVSCSKMHKLTSRPLEITDFVTIDDDDRSLLSVAIIPRLNSLITKYNFKSSVINDKEREAIWRKLNFELPSSYIQRRTVMASYAALRNIYLQREGHKLSEWEEFRKWIYTLPESKLITLIDPETSAPEDPEDDEPESSPKG